MTRIGIVGFGEVGGIFAADFAAQGCAVAAFDSAEEAQARAAALGMAAPDAPSAARDADAIFVCVTAGATPAAMASLAGGLVHRPLVVDVNSVSPAVKREAADIVEAAGGRYVEAAVMASAPPKRLATPMLLGGPHAGDAAAALAPFGMDLTVFSEEIGRASSVKMCRSVMIKGLEALALESLLAARRYGVEAEVLASLSDTLPGADWPKLSAYLVSRALRHGMRRAEEMREVARTVEEAGVAPLASRAIAERQDWAGRMGRAMRAQGDAPEGIAALLDALSRRAGRAG